MAKDISMPQKGTSAMVQDLVLALVFLAMIIAPAIISIPPERDEKDSL